MFEKYTRKFRGGHSRWFYFLSTLPMCMRFFTTTFVSKSVTIRSEILLARKKPVLAGHKSSSERIKVQTCSDRRDDYHKKNWQCSDDARFKRRSAAHSGP
ncbi:hypothetical protein AVEN_11369-1 [Araneus ventricosus]|uniref:Uncharacterized protein n=1 Tax=Araneus ventricosus TaxID=182803 RepID=A0A4Y2Q4Y0_ARAVE|nr:hypothetical protein AVEN_11369-1 [Araneus ventricosus]